MKVCWLTVVEFLPTADVGNIREKNFKLQHVRGGGGICYGNLLEYTAKIKAFDNIMPSTYAAV